MLKFDDKAKRAYIEFDMIKVAENTAAFYLKGELVHAHALPDGTVTGEVTMDEIEGKMWLDVGV